MNYVVFFPKAKNVHLIKDVGMIAYKLKELYNYNSKLVCYNNDDYSYLNDEVKGLKVEFIKQKYKRNIINEIMYLKNNAKNIDILQIFHVTLTSIIYTIIYKKYNPKGKIFLKLDCSHKLIDKISGLGSVQFKLLNKFLTKIDLIGIEQEELRDKIKKLLESQREKISLVPNGVDFKRLKELNIIYNYKEKENIILNVARIGAKEKNTEMLLNSFAIVAKNNSKWKLHLVGPIDEGFKCFIDEYYDRYPYLKSKVIFKGEIKDRTELYNEYKKAKIFCLTSNFESVGIAFIEAAALGDVIISTDVGIARELITDGNGDIVPVSNSKKLTLTLERFTKTLNLQKYSEKTYKICKEKYDIDKIIEKLKYSLEK